MYRHLPSLSALRVFEAAGRHESFTLAADELYVTTSAVSRQIRALEDELGLRLFERRPRGLELTKEGAAYLAEVADGAAPTRAGERVAPERRRAPRAAPERAGELRGQLARAAAAGVRAGASRHRSRHGGDDALRRFPPRAGRSRDPLRHGAAGMASMPSRSFRSSSTRCAGRTAIRGDPPLRRLADLARHTWLEEIHVPVRVAALARGGRRSHARAGAPPPVRQRAAHARCGDGGAGRRARDRRPRRAIAARASPGAAVPCPRREPRDVPPRHAPGGSPAARHPCLSRLDRRRDGGLAPTRDVALASSATVVEQKSFDPAVRRP